MRLYNKHGKLIYTEKDVKNNQYFYLEGASGQYIIEVKTKLEQSVFKIIKK